MQMQHGQLRVGERIENPLVIGTSVFLIGLDLAKLALCIENAYERSGSSNLLAVPDVIDC